MINQSKKKRWDRIYITSLFTFDFDEVVKTVEYYSGSTDPDELYVGGILASLMTDKLIQATGLSENQVMTGLFTDSARVGDDSHVNIDSLPLDYDILEDIEYEYPASGNYFAYITRGCPNKCPFCAVPKLEPEFFVANNIKEVIKEVDDKYGPKRNLLLLDNNILNCKDLERIVDDLCEAGFYKGAKYVNPPVYNIVLRRFHRGDRQKFLNEKLIAYLDKFPTCIRNSEIRERFVEIVTESKTVDDYAEFILENEEELTPIIEKYAPKCKRNRYIDFNQGVDGRKINDENMAQLARLNINPLRIAFDNVAMKDVYCNAVRTAHRHGINKISNYILFNFEDKPEDLYERLKVNIELNKELGISIFSFPMKYAPLDRTDRKHIGPHWKKKYLTAVSGMLQVSKGAVAAGSGLFERTFGKDLEEFKLILAMPRDYIIFRSLFEDLGYTQRWKSDYLALRDDQKEVLIDLVSNDPSKLAGLDWPEDLEHMRGYYRMLNRSGKILNPENI